MSDFVIPMHHPSTEALGLVNLPRAIIQEAPDYDPAAPPGAGDFSRAPAF